jgi:deoxyribodipyrimidine photo-lyase
MNPTLVWFRQDLRLQDNPALDAALRRGGPVAPVFIWDEAGEGEWPAGGATKWWLHHSLTALDGALRERGLRLVVRRGDSAETLTALARETGAGAVYWNRRYEPAAIARDTKVKSGLQTAGIEAQSFNAALLFEPHTVKNKSGGPFQVFTPFWRHCLTLKVEPPVKPPVGAWPAPKKWPVSLAIGELELLPRIGWDAGLGEAWQPGEAGALRRLRKFAADAMDGYVERRNLPAADGTSALSPYLHFGEIGPRQIWAEVAKAAGDSGVFPPSRGAQVFLSEVGWREFAHHLLYHFPHTPAEPLREEFAKFPWRDDAAQLRAWRRGRTGYPIVDAGMRQLWCMGWMHNRVRMIVASFLVKHLRMDWRRGVAWFWDTLVDADLANNTLGWQWTAGCGADAAPYFRVFNPVLQGEKFDANGAYVRHWVPELARLSTRWIHRPWEAPAAELAAAGVTIGGNYPAPIVDHAAGRSAALAVWQGLRKARPGNG